MSELNAKELAQMTPYGAATAPLEKDELTWIQKNLPKEAWFREEHELSAVDVPTVARADTNRLEWTVAMPCKTCEGIGSLYTISGKWADDCHECDGTGEADSERTFITDNDGHAIAQETLQ